MPPSHEVRIVVTASVHDLDRLIDDLATLDESLVDQRPAPLDLQQRRAAPHPGLAQLGDRGGCHP